MVLPEFWTYASRQPRSLFHCVSKPSLRKMEHAAFAQRGQITQRPRNEHLLHCRSVEQILSRCTNRPSSDKIRWVNAGSCLLIAVVWAQLEAIANPSNSGSMILSPSIFYSALATMHGNCISSSANHAFLLGCCPLHPDIAAICQPSAVSQT